MISQNMFLLGSKRSCIRELFEYGLQQSAIVGKENIFDFSIGNPSIPSPPAVNRAIVDIVNTEDSLTVHGYTPAAGDMGVRTAIADNLNQHFNTHIRPQNLFMTCGAAPALMAVIRALAIQNAEIMAIAPYFPEYRPFVENQGAKFVTVPADTVSFQLPLDEIERRLTPDTQAIIINSPNNPSGVVYTKVILEKLSEILREKSNTYGHPIYLIADEPYRELVYDGAEVPFIPDVYPDTIVCYSWSKSLSLPGERIGYICVPDQVTGCSELLAAVAGAARILGHVCAPSLQQQVVKRCIEEVPDITAYDCNRKTLYEALTNYGYQCVKPMGAFYLFVRAPGNNAKAFSDAAKEKKLLIVPGDDFGCPEFFRLSTCVAHDMILRSLPIFQKLFSDFTEQHSFAS